MARAPVGVDCPDDVNIRYKNAMPILEGLVHTESRLKVRNMAVLSRQRHTLMLSLSPLIAYAGFLLTTMTKEFSVETVAANT